MGAAPKKKPTRELIRAADVKPEKLQFLLDDVIGDRVPLGAITLFGGRPGQGKSLLTNWLAAEITNRGDAVIMSNPEDQLAAVKVPRLLAAKADTRLVHFWPGKMKLPQDVEMLEELVLFHGVKLVTIDPIAKHVGGSDPNSALEPLAAMAERTGVAVVGVHHLNKRLPKDAHPQEAFGGASGGWLGTVRFAHVLGPTGAGEPESRFMGVAKANNAEDQQPSIEFYLDTVEVDLPDGTVDETARLVYVNDTAPVSASEIVQWRGNGFREENPEKKAVASEFLALLLMNGPVPAKDVFTKAAEHGVSKMTVRRAAEELGVVKKRVGFGPGSYLVWELPADHPLLRQIGGKDTAKKKAPAKGKKKPLDSNGNEPLPGQMDVDEVLKEILGGDGDGDA